MTEYIVVKDLDNNIVGKRVITSKVMAENVAAFIVNNTLVYPFSAFAKMQEEASIISTILE